MGNHSNHPGHGVSCPLQAVVTAHPLGTSSDGYRCEWTGGHCLPGDYCAERCYEAGRAAGRALNDAEEHARDERRRAPLEIAKFVSRVVRS